MFCARLGLTLTILVASVGAADPAWAGQVVTRAARQPLRGPLQFFKTGGIKRTTAHFRRAGHWLAAQKKQARGRLRDATLARLARSDVLGQIAVELEIGWRLWYGSPTINSG